MAEKQNTMDALSALVGEQGQDALQMLRRMERLKRLMGMPQKQEAPAPSGEKKEEMGIFARSNRENMITAAIPFLDREYQRDLYLVVRLMEMQRVLSDGLLEARGKREESPSLRRRQMLSAVRPYLPHEDRIRLDTLLKVMDMREIMKWESGT